MNYDENYYYHPEKHDLEIVAELNDPNASYSFDDLVVWKHRDGTLYWQTDSGCSCPSPFEDYNTLDDLNKLTKQNVHQFEKAVNDHCGDGWNTPPSSFGVEKLELIKKVRGLLDA